MQPNLRSRRVFLKATALAGGAAAVMAAAPAAAFRLVPADDYAAVIENACGDEAKIHAKLLDDVKKQLGIELSEEEAQRILKEMRCPSCGCGMLEVARQGAEGGGF